MRIYENNIHIFDVHTKLYITTLDILICYILIFLQSIYFQIYIAEIILGKNQSIDTMYLILR